MLDANLTLQNAAGAMLAANGDYFGRDPFLDFTARPRTAITWWR